MICMSPRAPAEERARGRNALSIRMVASTHAGSMPWSPAAAAASASHAMGKRRSRRFERPGPGRAPDGFEVPPMAGGELRCRGQVRALEAPHEVAPLPVEPVPEPEGVKLERAPVPAHAPDPVDALGGGAVRALDDAVGGADPIGGEESVVVAMGGDLGPLRFLGPPEGGEGAGLASTATEAPSACRRATRRGRRGHPPSVLRRSRAGRVRRGGGGCGRALRNAVDPLHRLRDPVVLRVAEPDAPGREGIELGGQGARSRPPTPPATRGPQRPGCAGRSKRRRSRPAAARPARAGPGPPGPRFGWAGGSRGPSAPRCPGRAGRGAGRRRRRGPGCRASRRSRSGARGAPRSAPPAAPRA